MSTQPTKRTDPSFPPQNPPLDGNKKTCKSFTQIAAEAIGKELLSNSTTIPIDRNLAFKFEDVERQRKIAKGENVPPAKAPPKATGKELAVATGKQLAGIFPAKVLGSFTMLGLKSGTEGLLTGQGVSSGTADIVGSVVGTVGEQSINVPLSAIQQVMNKASKNGQSISFIEGFMQCYEKGIRKGLYKGFMLTAGQTVSLNVTVFRLVKYGKDEIDKTLPNAHPLMKISLQATLGGAGACSMLLITHPCYRIGRAGRNNILEGGKEQTIWERLLVLMDDGYRKGAKNPIEAYIKGPMESWQLSVYRVFFGNFAGIAGMVTAREAYENRHKIASEVNKGVQAIKQTGKKIIEADTDTFNDSGFGARGTSQGVRNAFDTVTQTVKGRVKTGKEILKADPEILNDLGTAQGLLNVTNSVSYIVRGCFSSLRSGWNRPAPHGKVSSQARDFVMESDTYDYSPKDDAPPRTPKLPTPPARLTPPTVLSSPKKDENSGETLSDEYARLSCANDTFA